MHATKASKRLASLTAGVLVIPGFAAASSSAAVVPISLVKANKMVVRHVTSYAVVDNGLTTVTGSGSLSYYSSATSKSDGRWLNATTGTVSFTSKFAPDLRSNGTFSKIKTFAIGFTGTPVTFVQNELEDLLNNVIARDEKAFTLIWQNLNPRLSKYVASQS